MASTATQRPTAEELHLRILFAAGKIHQLRKHLAELADDCWENENSVAVRPRPDDLGLLIDALGSLQTPIDEISAATFTAPFS